MNPVQRMVVAILGMFALCGVAQADTMPTLALDPLGGAISGAAGTTVGWGFTLTNSGMNFAVVTNSDFCVVIMSQCSNTLGTYTAFAGPQFPSIVVGPAPESTSFTQAFDPTLLTGMGSFLINSGASGSVMGEIVLTYDLFSVSPNDLNFNPDTDTVSSGNSLMAPASVTVATQTVVPEPGSLLLLVSGLVALGGYSRRKAGAGPA
jgi:hypothetical protein